MHTSKRESKTDGSAQSLEHGHEVVTQSISFVLVDEAKNNLLKALGRLGVALRRLDVASHRKVGIGLSSEHLIALPWSLREKEGWSATAKRGKESYRDLTLA